MKICVISYDFWNYDGHIVTALRELGVDAHHIKLTAFRYPNQAAKIQNFFSKLFVGKNLKTAWRNDYLFGELNKIDIQDQILVINPESFPAEVHEKIKSRCKWYIAYLYDSMDRNPAGEILHFFDKVFTFDKVDAIKYHFEHITNYIYLKKDDNNNEPAYHAVYLGSLDDRLSELKRIAQKLNELKLRAHLLIITKKSWKKNSAKLFGIKFSSRKIAHSQLKKFYQQGDVIIDLVRGQQTGLSFRIFEAMALSKKVITNNPAIKNYDFYKSGNFLLIDNDLKNITEDFFEKKYNELSPDIYEKYKVESWAKKVFNLYGNTIFEIKSQNPAENKNHKP